jgi:hypothetical protein
MTQLDNIKLKYPKAFGLFQVYIHSKGNINNYIALEYSSENNEFFVESYCGQFGATSEVKLTNYLYLFFDSYNIHCGIRPNIYYHIIEIIDEYKRAILNPTQSKLDRGESENEMFMYAFEHLEREINKNIKKYSFYCQSAIENESCCPNQCEHCMIYYAPLEEDN